MSKKMVNKRTLNPKATIKPVGKSDLLLRQELSGQQMPSIPARLNPVAAVKSEQVAPEPTIATKPLASLDNLWPAGNGRKETSNVAKQSREPASSQKSPAAAAPNSTMEPAQVSASAQSGAKPGAVPAQKAEIPKAVKFALVKPNARQVSVCGEFNAWSPGATPMKLYEDGRW